MNLDYEFDAKDYEAAKNAGMTFKNVGSFLTPITETETNLEDIYLKPEVAKILSDPNKTIHLNKPGKDFEKFLVEVFRKIPGVFEVKKTASDGNRIMAQI